MSKVIHWMPLRNLPPGMIFVTVLGTLAVKSEYKHNGQSMCILLKSGEYAVFVHGDDTLVRAVELK